ncbi:MAG: GNAT family N-acetyltransferase [Actinomycetia bacterium]|nr:GNAT family N-acetyltransferase [Actinomycetes bacterium]
MSFLIAPFEPKMLDEVAALRLAVFGRTLEFNRAYLTWKYLQNPYIQGPVLHVAHKDGEIVGMRGWFGTSWQVPGRDAATVIPQAAESAILPDHRHQGLFRELTQFGLDELRRRGYPLVMSMSATEYNYEVATKSMGWRSAGNYQPLVWSGGAEGVDDPSEWRKRSAERLRTGVKSTRGISWLVKATRKGTNRVRGASAADPFRRLEEPLAHPEATLRMERTPRPSVMAEIASSSDDRSRIIHTRDETYFSWRYGDPRSTYRFFYPTGDAYDGFCVLSGASSGQMSIVDWSSDGRVVVDLINILETTGAASRLDIWGTGLPVDLSSLLRDTGFKPEPNEKRGLILRTTNTDDQPWSADAESLLDIDDWNLRMIFSDRH